jgi:hypothetical protein
MLASAVLKVVFKQICAVIGGQITLQKDFTKPPENEDDPVICVRGSQGCREEIDRKQFRAAVAEAAQERHV